jgi:hypothetical protein
MQIGLVDETQRSDTRLGLQMRDGGANRDFRRLLQDDAPDTFNFWFVRVRHADVGEDAYRAPRHNHTFQQIQYIEEGERDWAPGQVIPQGCIAYTPRGAYYGPQHLQKPVTSWGVQFGFNGEQQRGDYWESKRAEALERLYARGKIENGVYIETDPISGKTTVRDSMDALYDERHQMLKGEPLVIPPARYEAPIIMHPENFRYYQGSPGVEIKHLGKFYDQDGPNGDVSISIVRLTGGIYPLRADRPQVAWTLSAGLKANAQTLPERASVYSPRGEEGGIGGDGGIEVFVIEFPALG